LNRRLLRKESGNFGGGVSAATKDRNAIIRRKSLKKIGKGEGDITSKFKKKETIFFRVRRKGGQAQG